MNQRASPLLPDMTVRRGKTILCFTVPDQSPAGFLHPENVSAFKLPFYAYDANG